MTSTIYNISSLDDDPCRASLDAFYNSMYEFYQSASTAGLFSTSTLDIGVETDTFTDYSVVIYTSRDGQDEHSYVSTEIPSIRKTTYPVTDITVFSPTYPGSSPTCEISTNCSDCTISAPKVQLIYWPVHTISGHPNLTVAPNATEPVTAIVNGTTFTSPTVYLSYDGAFAVDYCSRTIGKSYSGAVLSLNPNDASSISSIHGASARVDFADLNKPYPLNVLFGMCWPTPPESCVLDPTEEYSPSLVVPAEIRTLDPAWKTCEPDFFGSYDPPQILVPVQALVSPTAAVEPEATSTAMPVPIRTAPGAVSTSKPPAKDPPADDPPANDLPTNDPPTKDPPAKDPPANDPPAKDPPTKDPPANDPPANDPPANDPPANDPPANDPPANDPPANDPPANDPPTKDPPAKNLPTNDQPAKDPPAKNPYANDQSTIDPYVNNPPAKDSSTKGPSTKDSSTKNPPPSDPPAKDPPAKDLPAENTPAKDPPANDPPSNDPPAKDSPVKVPPAKDPPAEDPPATDPPGASSPVKTSVSDHFSIISRSQILTANSVNQPVFGTQTLLLDENNVSDSPIPTGLQTLPRKDRFAFLGMSISPLPSPFATFVGSDTKILYPTFTLLHLIIASQTYTANSASRCIIGSQTLTPNGQIIVSGTPISLLQSASALVIGSTTETLPPTFALPPLTIGAKTFTANFMCEYIVHDQTLTKGGQITVAGTPISLAVETSTPPAEGATNRMLPTATPTPLISSPETYSVKPASRYIIDDQTLTPSGVFTVQGTPISLAPESSILVIGSSTENSQAASSALGLGRLIMEGLGAGTGDDGGSEHISSDGTTGHGGTVTNSASARVTEGSGTIARGSSANFTGAPFIGAAERRKDQVWLGAAAVLSTLVIVHVTALRQPKNTLS